MKKGTKILSVVMALVMSLSVFALAGLNAAASTYTGLTANGEPILATGNTRALAAEFAVGETVFGTVNSGETVYYYFMNDTAREVTFTFTPDSSANFTLEDVQGKSIVTDVATAKKEYKATLAIGGHYIIIKSNADEGKATAFSFSTYCANLPELKLDINKASATLNSGDKLQLALLNLPVENINYYWTVFDNKATTFDETKIVTVTQDGNVTVAYPASGLGFTQNITVKVHAVFYYGGQYLSKYCTVTAVPANIFLNPYCETLTIGKGAARTINATTNVSKNIVWTSSNPNVATVTNAGLITGVAAGTTILTAKIDGTTISRSITLTVDASIVSVKSVTFTNHTASVRANESTKLTWGFTTSNGTGAPTDSSVTLTSSNPAVATVDRDGKVTGVSTGSATITITSADGNFTDTCLVTVNEAMPTWLVVIIAPLRIIFYLIQMLIGK